MLLRWAATDMKDVQKVVAKLMTSLQTEGEKGMVVVLDNSAPNNPLKSMEYEKVRVAVVYRFFAFVYLLLMLLFIGTRATGVLARLFCARERKGSLHGHLCIGVQLHA